MSGAAAGAARQARASGDRARVRLLFVDEGVYHHEELTVPAAVLGRYERLIDCLREEPQVLAETYVDVARLCAAWLVDPRE